MLGRVTRSMVQSATPRLKRSAEPWRASPGRSEPWPSTARSRTFPPTTRRLALEAVRDANALLEERNDLAIAALIAQIRSTTVDMVRGTGMDYKEALSALEESVASSPQEPADAPRSPDPSQESQ